MTLIIAEAGVNHNGSLKTALEMVMRAADTGVDCVKFQSFKAENLVTSLARMADYQKKTMKSDISQLELLKSLEITEADHFALKEACIASGVEFMSTAFDSESLDFLVNGVGIERLKVSSGDLTNGPFLLEHAMTGKNIIISTGMANLDEIETALGVLAYGFCEGSKSAPSDRKFRECYRSQSGLEALQNKVTILHCSTDYPALPESLNLNAIELLSETFSLPVGYSDHSDSCLVPSLAIAKGASVIEKHFTLDRTSAGPDHAASLEIGDLKKMVAAIRYTEIALGQKVKIPSLSEEQNIPAARKYLVAVEPIKTGEVFSEKNVGAMRSGGGVSPMEYWSLLGQKAHRDYDLGDRLVI